MECWAILGIAPTTDKTGIQRAYARAKLLSDPEAGAKELGRLRNAFLTAMREADWREREKNGTGTVLQAEFLAGLHALPAGRGTRCRTAWSTFFHSERFHTYAELPGFGDQLAGFLASRKRRDVRRHVKTIRTALWNTSRKDEDDWASEDEIAALIETIHDTVMAPVKPRPLWLSALLFFVGCVVIFIVIPLAMAVLGVQLAQNAQQRAIEELYEGLYDGQFSVSYEGMYPYQDEPVRYNRFTIKYTPVGGETRLYISSFDVFLHRGERKFQLQDDFMRNILSSLAGRQGILEQFRFAERLDYSPGYVRLSYGTDVSKEIFFGQFVLLEQNIQNSVIPDHSMIEVDIIREEGGVPLNEPRTYRFQFTKGEPADLEEFQALLDGMD